MPSACDAIAATNTALRQRQQYRAPGRALAGKLEVHFFLTHDITSLTTPGRVVRDRCSVCRIPGL